MSYTLKIGSGADLSFKDWAIEEAGATFTNGGRDFARLTQALDSVGEPPEMTEDAIAIVKRGTEIVFSGRVLPRARSQSGKARGDIIIAGPWMDLERRQYMQPWARAFSTGVAATVQATRFGVGDTRSVWQEGWAALGGTQLFGRVFLGADPDEWDDLNPHDNRLTTGQQIAQILTYAIAKGARLKIGRIDPGILMPMDRAQDITCAQAIQRCLRWTPSSVAWIDYATTPPSFHVTDIVPTNVSPRMRGGTLESHGVAMPVTDFEDKGFLVVRELGAQVKGVILTVKLQLAKKGVQYNVPGGDGTNVTVPQEGLTGLDDPVTTDFARYAWPVGAVEGSEDVVSFSLDGSDLGGEEPTTLVQKIYELSQSLGWSGRGTLVGADVPDVIGLGNVLNLTGGATVWETMKAPIQTMEDDWMKGRRRLTWGPPRALGTADLAALLLANRSRIRPAKQHRAQQATGGSGDTWGFGEEDSDTKSGSGSGAETFVKLVTDEGVVAMNVLATSKNVLLSAPSTESAVTMSGSTLGFTPIDDCGA